MTGYVFANDLPYAADGRLDPLTAIGDTLAFASNDWSESRATSWIYGIVLGWDCDRDHAHDEDCVGAMEEVAARYGWDAEQVAKLRALHARWRELEAGTR